MADLAHFIPVHGSKDIVYFENEFRDHVIMQRFGAGHLAARTVKAKGAFEREQFAMVRRGNQGRLTLRQVARR